MPTTSASTERAAQAAAGRVAHRRPHPAPTHPALLPGSLLGAVCCFVLMFESVLKYGQHDVDPVREPRNTLSHAHMRITSVHRDQHAAMSCPRLCHGCFPFVQCGARDSARRSFHLQHPRAPPSCGNERLPRSAASYLACRVLNLQRRRVVVAASDRAGAASV